MNVVELTSYTVESILQIVDMMISVTKFPRLDSGQQPFSGTPQSEFKREISSETVAADTAKRRKTRYRCNAPAVIGRSAAIRNDVT